MLQLTIYYGTASPGLKMTGECIVIHINIILYATTNHYNSLMMSLCPGLDVDIDHILEMACIITDGDMNIIAKVQLE